MTNLFLLVAQQTTDTSVQDTLTNNQAGAGAAISVVIVLLIFAGAIFLIIKAIQAIGKNSQNKKSNVLFVQQKLNEFNPDKKYINPTNKSAIAFNEAKRQLLIVDKKHFNNLYEAMAYEKSTGRNHKEFWATTIEFANILQSEIKTDDQTISKKSTSRTLGGVLVGGALLGGAGAIVGGLSGAAKNFSKTKSIDLVITTKTLSDPIIKFRFFDSPQQVSSSSSMVKYALDNAEQWQSIISIIIDQEDKQV